MPIVWKPAAAGAAPSWGRPGALTAMLRGAAGRCPCCGRSPLFSTWLRQMPVCAACHAPLGAVQADDAPPYFVVFLTAHLIIGFLVFFDASMGLSVAAETAIFLPITLLLCLGLLRPVKGATIGLLLQLGIVDTDAAGSARV